MKSPLPGAKNGRECSSTKSGVELGHSSDIEREAVSGPPTKEYCETETVAQELLVVIKTSASVDDPKLQTRLRRRK
ncbi:hypothetical protein FRC17_000480, partial [Serendipita sp. 399]